MRAWAVKDRKSDDHFALCDLSLGQNIAEARAASLNWSWRTKTRFKAVPVEIIEVEGEE